MRGESRLLQSTVATSEWMETWYYLKSVLPKDQKEATPRGAKRSLDHINVYEKWPAFTHDL